MNFKSFFKNERGHAAVIVTFSFTALLAMTGLVVDGGMLYMTKTHLQKTANASVLSGAQELTADDELTVRQIVDETLGHHEELDSFSGIIINLDEKVTLELQKPVNTVFMKLFGIDSIDVEARATASLGKMGRAIGAAPLGIDESVQLNYGEEYSLKVDAGDSDTGNFGVLALDGPGAQTYEQTLLWGSDYELTVGDVLDTQTGNIAGKTRSSVEELVNSCENMYERDCRRILLIPVYKPYNHDQNQMQQVEITGFAYFYISEAMSHDDDTIRGTFIERTGTGFELDEAVERGAFTVRLTE
ncbi:hypothetical protein CEY16_11055 [Halalkalibacillus sediminis]|uniref:Putative Flp pilus-assembly TadG-like N-terminal domain-containing protein n=1 Tax=Halalkalibacillus sediminis TaxID=2018042 RepID=A0A2I0QSI4_9BACI|nr:TadE/TadG family type IV pilus assembly protein [Halalkalibacillus sediminis]PKR77268.1 hypothetical protein CEY16_11055 [Halalkalibacillus sediminis]